MKNLYEALGVNKDATVEEIKKSYRNKSKVHHPDKGGDSSEFQLITTAYKILTDDEKRKRYDSGASAEDLSSAQNNFEAAVMKILGALFMDAAINTDIERQNIVLVMTRCAEATLSKINLAAINLTNQKKRFESVIKRLKSTTEQNIFKEMALAQVGNIESSIARLEREKLEMQEVIKRLAEYSYEVSSDNAQVFSFGGNLPSSTSTF